MLYEMRIYDVSPGKLPALHDRFEDHVVRLSKKHGIRTVGYWTADIGTGNQLTFMWKFEDQSDRETRVGTFMADAEWQAVLAETEKGGPMVEKATNIYMRLTPYSPEPIIKSSVQELRIYDAMPGKLPALHDRFANHTIGLFKKHDIENIAYWTEDVGTSNRLVYMLGYASLGDREKSWADFAADPDWQKARAESERDGPLVRKTYSSILRPTHYSPR